MLTNIPHGTDPIIQEELVKEIPVKEKAMNIYRRIKVIERCISNGNFRMPCTVGAIERYLSEQEEDGCERD